MHCSAKTVASGCERRWVADITYLPTKEKAACLSLVTEQVSQVLKMALRQRQTDQPLVHHSDPAIQYCSAQYQCIHAHHLFHDRWL